MGWTEQGHKDKYNSLVIKLIQALKKQGLTIELTDGHLNNVVITNGKKTLKISHECFYGYSRQAVNVIDLGKNKINYVPISQDEYINDRMKSLILYNFGILRKAR